jgi:hypothetical protein
MLSHDTELMLGWNVPQGHSGHTDAPDDDWNEPAAQAEQGVMEPVEALKKPGKQLMQADAPKAGW